MARIRTIKPEFPQSESLGRVSRDARLLFVLLFTIADDSGRLRGNSRMLASLLFPYDDDAPSLIDGWVAELEAEGCIRRYDVGGSRYIDIPKWLEHQRIDKPSASKIPEFVDPSKNIPGNLEKPLGRKGRERKGKEGKGEEGNARGAGADAPPLPARSDIECAREIYNDVAMRVGLPVAQVISEGRAKKLAQRLIECGGLDGWAAAIAKLEASPFLCGHNERGWKADFDFLLQQKSFTRLMEGSYERNGTKPKHDNGFAELFASGELGGLGRG